jgi:HD-GYP domain-containing protein (c-di-GMP phosphodiesterase class II)
MPKRVVIYVVAVTILAAASIALLVVFGPTATEQTALISAFLALTGWTARRLTHEGNATGSESRIYYLVFPAAGIAAGDWTAAVSAAITVFAIDAARRAGRPWTQVVFNAAAVGLASSASILAYRAAGGDAWVRDIQLTAFPFLILLVTSRLTNDAIVAGVLSLSQNRPVWATWRAVTGRTLVDDVLVAPLVGLLAYAISAWGYPQTIAISASLIWVNRLYKANRELARNSEELLELMVTAIEARDPYTSGHSRRVSRLAMEIARCIGLPEREVKRIGVAGLLHDVGKIHEKYASILQKPDRLTKDEWLLMKDHPSDGEALIAKVSQLHDILQAVRHHHERWDGSGYPDGLRGESIPLMARVLTFADTIDAMTSTRPYRRGLTQGEVREELLKFSGKQFDPKIASVLLASNAWATLIQPMDADVARYGLQLVPARTPALA